MNSAAGLVFSVSWYDNITPLLTQRHCLKVPERIELKLDVLAYIMPTPDSSAVSRK